MLSLHHAAHAAHAAHVGAAHRHGRLVFRQVGAHAVGGQHQAGDRRGVLQRGAGDLGGVEHAHRHHVAVLAGAGVVAEVAGAFEHLVDHDRRLVAAVLDDLAQRLLDRAQDDLHAGVLVVVVALDGSGRGLGAQQCDAAAGDDAFFNGGTRGVQRVFDASPLLLHLDFGRSADLEHRHAAGQLGLALLQLLAVVVAGDFVDLLVDLGDAALDRVGIAGTVDDGGVFLADFDALGAAEVLQGGLLERQADFLCDHGAAGEDGHVFQLRLAAVAEARGLDSAGLEDAADVVDHQGGERFAVDVFGDDHQRLAGLGDLFQHRQQVADVGDLLVEQQYERIFHDRHLLVGVVDEVVRQVAAVELHAFDDVEFVLQTRAVFDRDDAFLADLVHGGGDDVADRGGGVGGNGADLVDFLGGLAGLGNLLQFSGDGDHGLVDAALQIHRVHAGGDELHAFVDDGLGQHGGGGGAVTRDIGGLGSHFLDHLRAHVLQLVLQLDFLGDRLSVVRRGGGAVGTVEHHVAAFRAQGHLDGVSQNIDTSHHAVTRGIAKTYVFCSHALTPKLNSVGLRVSG